MKPRRVLWVSAALVLSLTALFVGLSADQAVGRVFDAIPPETQDLSDHSLPGDPNGNGESMERYNFSFVHDGMSFQITCPFDGGVRIRALGSDGKALPGAWETLKLDLNESVEEDALALEVEESASGAVISCEDLELKLIYKPFSLSVTYEDELRTMITDLTDTAFSAKLRKREAIFGTGERFNLANQRGKLIDLYSMDKWCQTEGNSYIPVPLLLSSAGYAYYINRYERMTLDLGASDSKTLSAKIGEEGILDLYLFCSDDPAEALYDYAYLTGFSPELPDWAYGIHVSRHGGLMEFGSAPGVIEMTRKMAENDLPWDTVILEGWEPYDHATRDELKQLSEYLHGLNKHVILYQSCGRYLEFKNQNVGTAENLERWRIHDEYAVSDANTGEVMLPDINLENPADAPNARIFRWLDITNPDAKQQWFERIWGDLITDAGVDGAKMDFCEQFPGNRPLNFYSGRSISGSHHWYPVLLNSLTYRNFAAKAKDGAMLFARGGGIGAQRYPMMWAGDQLREWRFLPAMLRGVLSAGMSGVPFVAFDLGGYMPSRDQEANPERDIFLRGAEMACFSVCMQTHGKVTRPYDFDPETIDVYRLYCNLHEKLIPYLVEQGKVSTFSGMPLCRHLFLVTPEDETVWGIDDEYFLGDALLVAPVMENAEKRDIYLPAGEYRDLFTGKTYAGGQTIKDYPAPLYHTPVFIKTSHMSDVLGACLADAEGELYELARLSGIA